MIALIITMIIVAGWFLLSWAVGENEKRFKDYDDYE